MEYIEQNTKLVELEPRRGQYLMPTLKALGTGVVLLSGVVAPNAISILGPMLAERDHLPRSQTERALHYARRQGWLIMNETEEGVEIGLSPAGQIKWHRINLTQPLAAKRWDNKWRIIIFDIPSKRRAARDALRASLKQLGCKQLQKSVWLTPYPCRPAIAALQAIYRIPDNQVRVIEASNFDGDGKLKTRFELNR